MPQVKAKVDWYQNTHLPPPNKDPVRFDNSDVAIENDKMEEEKAVLLDSLHLARHRAILDKQQEMKTVKQHAIKYTGVKRVIDPRRSISSNNLVKRSFSFYPDTQFNKKKEEPDPLHTLRRSNSWTYVSTANNLRSWDKDFGHLPPVPFSRQPLKMRYIPSVERSQDLHTVVYKSRPKVPPNLLSRRRAELLGNQARQECRSYQTLKELSDINKMSEQDKRLLRQRILLTKRHILHLYNESLKTKIGTFHKNMDNFKIENGAKPYSLETLKNAPKIY